MVPQCAFLIVCLHHHIYIYLGYFVCLCVIVCVTIAERTAILLVLIIKLTKETRRRVWRGRDYRGKDRKGTDQRGRVLWIPIRNCLYQKFIYVSKTIERLTPSYSI